MDSKISPFEFHYAGFWKRLLAALIDGFVLLPVILLSLWLQRESRTLALAGEFLSLFLISFYWIFFTARWGQTIGKMVANVKVVRVDGSPIGWKESLLRHSVDLALALLLTCGQVLAILAISDETYLAGLAGDGFLTEELNQLHETLLRANPLPTWVSYISLAWGYSEMIVLLFNKRKRALHDFIAGTVVVYLKRDKVGLEVPELATETA